MVAVGDLGVAAVVCWALWMSGRSSVGDRSASGRLTPSMSVAVRTDRRCRDSLDQRRLCCAVEVFVVVRATVACSGWSATGCRTRCRWR